MYHPISLSHHLSSSKSLFQVSSIYLILTLLLPPSEQFLLGGDLAVTQALLAESEIELTGKIIPGPKQVSAPRPYHLSYHPSVLHVRHHVPSSMNHIHLLFMLHHIHIYYDLS